MSAQEPIERMGGTKPGRLLPVFVRELRLGWCQLQFLAS